MGRNTQGVRLVKLGDDQMEQVVSVAMVADQEPATAEAGPEGAGDESFGSEPSGSSGEPKDESHADDLPDEGPADDGEE